MSNQGETGPNNKQAPSSTKPTANKNKSKSSGALLGFFVFLTFVLAVAGIGAGYYFWQQIQHDLQAAQTERKALEHALSTLDENPRMQKYKRTFSKQLEQTNADITSIDKQIDTLTSKQEGIAAKVASTSDIITRGQTGWMLKEVEHVLRMSQHRLLLDRDFQGALLGLRAADERLRDISDVRLIPIRESIAKQTQILKQYPHPDYVGIQLQLDNTIAQLKTGLLQQATAAAREEPVPTKPTPPEQPKQTEALVMDAKKLWQTAIAFTQDTIQRAKATLNDSVRITHGQQRIALFIEEQEKKRAYDFLRQKLLGAKYAVSTRDNLSYHQQLNAALGWLENNQEFINKDSLITEIKSLEKNDLLPKLPDISEPSVLLAKHMAATEGLK